MARFEGFDDLSEELEELANSFATLKEERGGEKLTKDGEPISVKGAIAQGMDKAVDENIIPDARAGAQTRANLNGSVARSIDARQGRWRGDTYVNHRIGASDDLVKYHEFGTSTRADDRSRATINAPGGGGYVIPRDGYDNIPYTSEQMPLANMDFEYVVHPGVRGKHFIRDAIKRNKNQVRGHVGSKIDEAMRNALANK